MDAIARLTRGERGVTGGDSVTPGDVFLFAGEDDVSATVRPRLDAAGADVDRVSVIQNYATHPKKRTCYDRPRLEEEQAVEMLESYLEGQKETDQPVRLFVIDPLNCYLEHIDSHREDQVRTMASKLVDLAQRWNTAILLIAQPAKAGIGKRSAWLPTTRVFAKSARSVWLITHDPDERQRRLLLPIKTNLCATPAGRGFRIQDQAVVWDEEPVPFTAEQSLTESVEQQQIQTRKQTGELVRAVEWVRQRLTAGPVLSSQLREDATASQISGATLRRALNGLNCHKDKEKGAAGRWIWQLPAHAAAGHRRYRRSCST